MTDATYIQKGFGLKQQVKGSLKDHYHSAIVDRIKENQYTMTRGDLTVRLAKEFGFCYGVDRTVQYAYETRAKFPDRPIFITNEIIHNPSVNEKLIELGMCFLSGRYKGAAGVDDLKKDDIVIVPAFGATNDEMVILRDKGTVIVDTTCGSVLNVWKNVERYARDGITSIVHGKYWHEETQATCSQVLKYKNAHYLVVYNLEECEIVCDYIRRGGTKADFLRRFEKAVSPGFDPDVHLSKIGLANQTTMLCSESLEIEKRLKEATAARFAGALADHFRAFDTICTATQDRQDAVIEMLKSPPDMMIVVGGYNSSNTGHLAEMAEEKIPSFHIEEAGALVSAREIRHHISGREVTTKDWLPAGPLTVGVTSGASTPNSRTGEVIERLFELKGAPLEEPAP